MPPNPCSGCGCGSLLWYKDCLFRNKKCPTCSRVGHKSSHCRARKKVYSCVKNTKSDEQDGKYVQVQILNKKIKLQLDSGSDFTIINLLTWKKLGKATLLRFNKKARYVLWEKIKFEGELITHVIFQGRTLKLKMFVLRNTENLFGTDWMKKFKLWDMQINSFCQKPENLTTEEKKLLKDLKETFPEVFFFFLGALVDVIRWRQNSITSSQCLRKKKCALRLFAANKWRTRQTWKNRDLVDNWVQSMGFTDCLCEKEVEGDPGLRRLLDGASSCTQRLSLSFTDSGRNFRETKWRENFFSKIDLRDVYLQIPVEEEYSKFLCINTHRELYKFGRVPFRVKVALANLSTSNGHYAEWPWLRGCIFGWHINEQSKFKTTVETCS